MLLNIYVGTSVIMLYNCTWNTIVHHGSSEINNKTSIGCNETNKSDHPKDISCSKMPDLGYFFRIALCKRLTLVQSMGKIPIDFNEARLTSLEFTRFDPCPIKSNLSIYTRTIIQ